MLTRLNKFIAESGLASRRHADEMITKGLVTVNGKICRELGQKIDSKVDSVEVEGKKISNSSVLKYYILYKPKGIISSASDEHQRKTVTDLVPSEVRLYPVGRLDADSEGLILLTNDGKLMQELTHPSFEHQKKYVVTIWSRKSEIIDQIKPSFERGLRIDNNLMRADFAQLIDSDSNRHLYTFEITLHTGYNRQIRRMFGRLKVEIKRLQRVAIGNLNQNDLKLKPGEFREIERSDIL